MTTLASVLIAIFLYQIGLKKIINRIKISVRVRWLLIIVIMLLLLLVGYFMILLDKQLYYFGKNNWGIHDKLLFEITPEYWGYDRGMLGFVLVQDGTPLIAAKGDAPWSAPDIGIKEIIKYGFNKEKLAVLVKDSLGKEYYVECEKQSDTRSKQALKIIVVPKQGFISKEQFKWIEINNNSAGKMEEVRNYLEILLLFLFLIGIYNFTCCAVKYSKRG